MAEAEHVPGMEIAKPVLIKADGEYYMCVLPACYKVDLNVLKKHLGLKQIELVHESEMTKLFGDCELGAEPPFGNLYGLVTFMDKTLETNEHIVFQSGTHEQAVRTAMAEYKRLVTP
jgi:Ala-tRNA(Pro) deacylase